MTTTSNTLPPAQRQVSAPTPEQVVQLQAVRHYPSLSLLMNTTPGRHCSARRLPLHQLVDRATRRVRAEGPSADGAAAVAALERLADETAHGPAGTALALYAGLTTAVALHLPVEVRERVVVDPTFATRDLVRALHRTPRHVVLVLSSRDARLFDGVGDQLQPALAKGFPLVDERERATHATRPRLQDSATEAFLRKVDAALGTYLRLRPAPLVLAGPPKVLAAFAKVSRNLGRLAGEIPVNLSGEPLPALAARTRPVLERYLLSRQQEALDLLERRVGAHRCVSGMVDAWLAARRERPEMLAVEQGLFYPARLSADGDLLTAASDVEHPEVLDDAVDELIELVLDRGGWVALVDDGALATHGGVALTLRSR
jgi:hypothetical protein